MILQRLRGLIGTTIAVSIPWTALGFLAGAILQFDLIPGIHAGIRRPIPGGLVTAGTVAGAFVGIVNGLVFSALVAAAERGKTVDEVRGWRFAAWSATATAATFGVLFQSPLAAVIGGVFGTIGGIRTAATLRRARLAATYAPSLSA